VTAFLAALCALLGLAIGSFLNVIVWRVPRGESVLRPASRCPRCEAPIRPRDNVPVLSWLVLRGRCRACSAPISVRYPLVEAATAGLFAALAVKIGPHAVLPAYLYLGAVAVALALIDLDVRRLPNAIVLPSYAVALVLLGLAAMVDGQANPLLRALFGMVAYYGVFFLLAFAYPAGMGFGDVKLAGVLGLYLGYLGWNVLAVGAFAGVLLGGVVGIGLLLGGRAGRKSAIPYGPFMLTGALLAVFVGASIAHGYVHLTGVS
jgi:leader peptidase (prepilin peptidase)/N-methyltransferase